MNMQGTVKLILGKLELLSISLNAFLTSLPPYANRIVKICELPFGQVMKQTHCHSLDGILTTLSGKCFGTFHNFFNFPYNFYFPLSEKRKKKILVRDHHSFAAVLSEMGLGNIDTRVVQGFV